MSRLRRSSDSSKLQNYAGIFTALGDKTRLSLVTQLSKGQALSISQLTEGSKLTRQAVTKHLKILKKVGIVQNTHLGRENLFELDPGPFKDIREYLEFVSQEWDQALSRLKAFVER